jgi:threonine dehydrogenase-like Zn-dependent dehydrogenase
VDCAVDAAGFEARAQGKNGEEAPTTVLNSLMSIVRAAGAIGIPGLYITEDRGNDDKAERCFISALDAAIEVDLLLESLVVWSVLNAKIA